MGACRARLLSIFFDLDTILKTGKRGIDESTLAILTYILKKTLGYFYPPYLYQELKQEDLTTLENELLFQFH